MSTNCRLERPTAVIMPASRDGGCVAGRQRCPRCCCRGSRALGWAAREGSEGRSNAGAVQPKTSKPVLHPMSSPAPESPGKWPRAGDNSTPGLRGGCGEVTE